jgi:hypothetical protein
LDLKRLSLEIMALLVSFLILVAIFLFFSGLSFVIVYLISYIVEVIVEYLFYFEFNLMAKVIVSLFSASLLLHTHLIKFNRKINGELKSKEELLFKILRLVLLYSPFIGAFCGVVCYSFGVVFH